MVESPPFLYALSLDEIAMYTVGADTVSERGRADMSRFFIVVIFAALVGCATPEARARLEQLEADLGRTRVELQAAEAATDTTKVSALETEIARLNGAVAEAEHQVARERESSLESSIQQAGGIASAVAPILGYFLPGAAGILGALGTFLSRRRA